MHIALNSLESSLLTLFGSLFALAFTVFIIFFCVRRHRDRRFRARTACLSSVKKKGSTVQVDTIKLENEVGDLRLSKSLNIADIENIEHSRLYASETEPHQMVTLSPQCLYKGMPSLAEVVTVLSTQEVRQKEEAQDNGNFLQLRKPPYLTKILSDIKEESTDRLHTFDVESRPASSFMAE